MHDNSHKIFRDFIARDLIPRGFKSGAVLDVGSMDVNGSYRAYFPAPAWRYHGIDIAEGPGVDQIVPDTGRWSLKRRFDVVVCGQTLEHVARPWILMETVGRHLRTGGLLFLAAPFAWDHHSYPKDCYRYAPNGLRVMLKMARCSPIRAELVSAGIPEKPHYAESFAVGIRKPD